MNIRSEYPRLNYGHGLAKDLYFAGLGPSRFVGTTWFHDSSLYGNSGTLTNLDPATDWVFDPYLGRWFLEIVQTTPAQYVLASATDIWPLGPVTFAMWCKDKSVANVSAILGAGAYAGSSRCSFTYTYSNQIGYWDFGGTSAGTSRLSFTPPANRATEWQHIALTADPGKGMGIYYNGLLVASHTGNSPTRARSTEPTYIGYNAASPAERFLGSVSDFLVYGRILSLPEIQTLANLDPWLGGLILPPTPKLLPTATTETPPAVTYRPMMMQVC